MVPYHVGAPMERIAMDFMGPFPVTHRGNKHILVVSDYFCKFTQGYPLPDQEAATVANVVTTNFISILGVPYHLHTDMGANFESHLFYDVCDIMGIDKTRTTIPSDSQ